MLLVTAMLTTAGEIVSIIGANVGNSRGGLVCATAALPATMAASSVSARIASKRRVGSVV